MKFILFHDYSYFTVFRVWATENATFKWMNGADEGPLAAATYYKGKLKAIEAFNPLVVGQTWRGHYDWFDRSTCPEHWYKVNEWQTCAPVEGDIEWWCLHPLEDISLSVKYLPVTSPRVVEADTSVLVLEGRIEVDDGGRQVTARDMSHVKPRSHAMRIDGDAKVWLIRRK
jgi:hypothetical protein